MHVVTLRTSSGGRWPGIDRHSKPSKEVVTCSINPSVTKFELIVSERSRVSAAAKYSFWLILCVAMHLNNAIIRQYKYALKEREKKRTNISSKSILHPHKNGRGVSIDAQIGELAEQRRRQQRGRPAVGNPQRFQPIAALTYLCQVTVIRLESLH